MVSNFVVVRFSLKLNPDWQRLAYGGEENRPAWFSYRAGLTMNVLLKCLASQTVRPACVFLLMDQDDRPLFQEYFKGHADMLVPVFSNGKDHFQQVANEISSRASGPVAISRIDSDDAVADTYFEKVNYCIENALEKGAPFTHVIATRGYRVSGGKVQEVFYNCSPFLTRYAERYSGQNVYDMNHELVLQQQHIICSDATWMQLIHGTNVSNKFIQSNKTNEEFLELIASNPKLIGDTPRPLIEAYPSGYDCIKGAIEELG